MEYEVARERHKQLLAEAETYRLQRRVGRRVTRKRAVTRLAMVGGCLAIAAVLAGVVASQGAW